MEFDNVDIARADACLFVSKTRRARSDLSIKDVVTAYFDMSRLNG